MNVGLWAEIRRLAEIEKLSGRAIARRLRCSRHLVTVALRLDQPPARQVARHGHEMSRATKSLCNGPAGELLDLGQAANFGP